ncbi:MAG: hypothetical protein HY951_00255 [Bacteroidia bacterium]|nr:hypothetical protein [Bacteroidia bacterium]
MEPQEFINVFIIKQSKKLLDEKSYIASIIILTIGIEIMGGFFDKKPLKSPKQSKARFKIAIEKLFGGKYAAINRDDSFYEMLRNQLIHSLTISNKIILSTEKEHLINEGTSIIFNPVIFFEDVNKAYLILIKLFEQKKAFPKRISDNVIELSKFI